MGDRDFALDWTWAAARVVLALGRIAADIVDYATSEFGLVTLDGAIATGSSMMPQKKNPDMFELVRGKSGRAVGNVVAMLTLMKGLASGYNRDQQEDRRALLEAAPLAIGSTRVVALSLPHVAFAAELRPARSRRGLHAGDHRSVAEELVRRGVPFREAYQAVGRLVALAVADGSDLVAIDSERAHALHPALDARALRALDPARAVAAKESTGGTGPRSGGAQVAWLRRASQDLIATADLHGSIDALAARVFAEPLEPT